MTKRIGWLAILAAPVFGQTPAVQAVVNSASLSSTVSPGLLAAVRGTDFASSQTPCVTAGGAPLQCGGVTVFIGGRAVPLTLVEPARIQVQVPFEIALGQAALVVERVFNGQTLRSMPFSIVIDTFAPGLMTVNASGSGDGLFYNANGSPITAANPSEPEMTVTVSAIGLGVTRPPAPSGTPPQSAVPTFIPPKVTVGSTEAAVTSSVLAPGLIGVYQVSFVVPKGTAPGSQLVWLELGSARSNVVSLAVGDPRRPLAAVAVNAASGDSAISSLSWVTLFGDRLAESTRQWTAADFDGVRLPLSLEGVSVTVNGKPAAIGFVSPSQVNLLTPADNAEGPVRIEITHSHGVSTLNTPYQRYSPGFFSYSEDGRSYAAAVHGDGTLVSRSSPAAPGELVLLFGTGYGPVAPDPPAGETFTGAFPLADAAAVAIRVGGLAARVEFAGLVSPGLYQFNVRIPEAADGNHQLDSDIGGYNSIGERLLSVRR